MAEDKDTKTKAPAKKTDAAKKAPAKKAASKKTDTVKPAPETPSNEANTAKAVADKPKTETKAADKPAKKSAPAKVKKPSGKTLKVTQIGSPAGRQAYQRATLIGLGLNKMHKTRELEDTPSVRGMINSIPHLVKIEDDAA